MRRRRVAGAAIIFIVAGSIFLNAALPSNAAIQPRKKSNIEENFGKLPLSFQAAGSGQFISSGSGYLLMLNSTGASIELRSRAPGKGAKPASPVRIQMRLAGASVTSPLTGVDLLPGKVNYLIGNDPAKWRTEIPTFAKVKCASVYPGIDLVYYGNQRRLEYDFIVAPGADPKAIALDFTGTDKIELDAEGNLVLRSSDRDLSFLKPCVYQTDKGIRREVKATYAFDGTRRVTFQLGSYDKNLPLIIDPQLAYSTGLGIGGNYYQDIDDGRTIAVDSDGNVFIAGQAQFSTDILSLTGGVVNVLNTPNGYFDPGFTGYQNQAAVVAKLNPSGTGYEFLTYILGINGNSTIGAQARGLALDSQTNVWVVGQTYGQGFPTTTNAFQSVYKGKVPSEFATSEFSGAGFVLRLSADGKRLDYSTLLSGSVEDRCLSVAVDQTTDNAYVVGRTYSSDFPVTSNAFQRTLPPAGAFTMSPTEDRSLPAHGFVAGFQKDGTVIFSSYLAGNTFDEANSVAVGPSSRVYVAGVSFAKTIGGMTPTLLGGQTPINAYIARILPDGTRDALTYLGSGDGRTIAVDNNENVYVAGQTATPYTGAVFPSEIDLPIIVTEPLVLYPTTPGAFLRHPGRCMPAFISKVAPTLTNFVYSTLLAGRYLTDVPGGEFDTSPSCIAVDADGCLYIAGSTSESSSTNAPTGPFPTTPDAYQTKLAGEYDVFVTKLNPQGSGLIYSTLLGGSNEDQALGIAVDAARNIYVTGYTSSTNFSLVNPLPGTGGGPDLFVAKFNASIDNHRPLILIPDLGANYLVNGAGDGWPAAVDKTTGDPTGLQCDLGGNSISAVVQAGGFLTNHPIVSLEQFFLNSGYTKDPPNRTLFAFTYDFRLSVSDLASSLGTLIQEIRVQTGAASVDIVAHGFGGMIAKQYLSGMGMDVANLVMVGTPHLGMPKALKMLRYGDTFSLNRDYGLGTLEGIKPDTTKAKRAAHNWPSLFNLLPTSNYFVFNGAGYFNNAAGIAGVTNEVRGLLDYTNTLFNLTNGVENFGLFQPGDQAPTNTLSSTLVDDEILGNWVKPTSVHVFNIAGYGVATLTRIAEKPYNGTTNSIDLVPTPAGDGMVPLVSAAPPLASPSLLADGFYYGDYLKLKADHASALMDSEIQKQILHLLARYREPLEPVIGNNPFIFGENIWTTAPASYKPQVAFATHSPVDVNVHDSEGNSTGVSSNGVAQVDVPGSSLDQLDDRQFVQVPGGDEYTVYIQGTDDGTFGFSQTDINSSNTVLRTLDWPSVQTSKDQLTELLTKFSANDPLLKIGDELLRPKVTDLIGSWMSLSKTKSKTKNGIAYTLQGNFLVQNRGRIKVSSSTVRIYLSDTPKLDPNKATIVTAKLSGTMSPGVKKKLDFRWTVPGSVADAGTYLTGKYVIAVVDADNVIAESDETNNTFIFGRLR